MTIHFNTEEVDGKLTLKSSIEDAPKTVRNKKGQSLLEAVSDYIVVDLETTGLSPGRDVIIELAAIHVKNNIIINHFQSLASHRYFDVYENKYIYSQLDEFIIRLTGITNEMLAEAPPFGEVFPKFLEFIGDNIIVAHNANFDINFIYDECIDGFPNNFIDTMRLSRRIFREHSSHTLSLLIERFGITGNVEHRALSDAMKTYECYEFMKKHALANGIEITSLYPKKMRYNLSKNITTDKTEFNEDTYIFGKVFVFTGTLDRMTRKDAMQCVVDMGGLCWDSVTKKTNYLVMGNTDYSVVKDGKSKKQKMAEQLALLGHDIQTITENVFYDMLADF
jgi:DNA polymerase-3 subunit epsilon